MWQVMGINELSVRLAHLISAAVLIASVSERNLKRIEEGINERKMVLLLYCRRSIQYIVFGKFQFWSKTAKFSSSTFPGPGTRRSKHLIGNSYSSHNSEWFRNCRVPLWIEEGKNHVGTPFRRRIHRFVDLICILTFWVICNSNHVIPINESAWSPVTYF